MIRSPLRLLCAAALLIACDPPGGNPDPDAPDPLADARDELAECVEQGDDADSIDGLRITGVSVDGPLDPDGAPTTITVSLGEVDGLDYMNYPLARVIALDPRLAVRDEVPPALTLFGIFGCTEAEGSTTLRVVGDVEPGERLPVRVEAGALNCDDNCGGHAVRVEVRVE